jgi:hypothetical protein
MLKKLFLLTIAVVLLVAIQVGVGSAELVVNGGFETGDFSGWIQWGDNSSSGVYSSPVYSGNYAAYFGPKNSMGGISQTFSTVADQAYTVSYYLANNNFTPNAFSLVIGGITISSMVNADGFDWTKYQFNFTAKSNATEMTFGFYQPYAYYFLDGVSVAPVPLPSALFLFAPGLLGLAAIRRRFTK